MKLVSRDKGCSMRCGFGATKVPAGSILMISNSAANRDPACFAAPQEFDQDRDDLRWHLAFGHGIHYCLGASLARLEARVMFEELLTRLPTLEQAGPPRRLRSNFINGIKELPVRVPTG